MLGVNMAAYYTSQGYDAPAALIWSILTDFPSWPRWFPNCSAIRFESGDAPASGARLLALGEDPNEWTRWQIAEWHEPRLLVCEHVESTAPMSGQVQAAYLQFELIGEPEGCTLEVEIGAEGHGMVGDFFVSMTLGTGVRRLLPQLVDAFTEHVVERVAAQR
jgi:uncharacterized protein YndB with AHSA1/START domain